MDDNVGDASGYQNCSMILQGLADCIACCGNSLEVVILSAFLSFQLYTFLEFYYLFIALLVDILMRSLIWCSMEENVFMHVTQ